MPFSLKKAIKSTHNHPINTILHFVGAPIYIAGIVLILDNLLFGIRCISLAQAVILYCTAIGLFLLGHKIQGNLNAMTLVLIFRYLMRSTKSRIRPTAVR